MRDSSDLERRLRILGTEPVPPADTTFADNLDVRLRVLHSEQLGPVRRRPAWVPALMGAVALAVLVTGGAFLLSRASEPSVIVTAAADTDVILPGDEATSASIGLPLPDGTRIIVGPDGEAVVNGLVLGPGSEAVVVGDQIDILVAMVDGDDSIDTWESEPLVVESERGAGGEESQTATGPETSRSTPNNARDTDQAIVSDEREADPEDLDRATTTAPDHHPGSTSSTSAVDTASTAPSRPTSTTTTHRTTSTTVERTTTTGQRLSPVELRVERLDRNRVRLDWTLNRNIVPAGWRVQFRNGDRVATLVAIRDGDVRSTTIERSAVSGGSVWVEALDLEGRVLLASEPVEIDGP